MQKIRQYNQFYDKFPEKEVMGRQYPIFSIHKHSLQTVILKHAFFALN